MVSTVAHFELWDFDIRFGAAPAPEIVGPAPFQQVFQAARGGVSLKRGVLNPISYTRRCFVVECDFQQYYLNNYHQGCLKEQGFIVICAKPVEHSESRLAARTSDGREEVALEDGRNEHDQGNVEREAITRFATVYRSDLISIGSNRGNDEAAIECECFSTAVSALARTREAQSNR
jgi:hypothetical protein